MFPLTSQVDPVRAVRAIPVEKISSRFPETDRDEEQGAVLYAPPTFSQGEERRGDGSIVQPAGGKPRK